MKKDFNLTQLMDQLANEQVITSRLYETALEFESLFNDGAICCDCRVPLEKRPKNCGECGILSLFKRMENVLGDIRKVKSQKGDEGKSGTKISRLD